MINILSIKEEIKFSSFLTFRHIYGIINKLVKLKVKIMKLKKLSIFWSIPSLTIYFYAANILAQYGYISYFNIPSSFIESSLKDNIIYFFDLFRIGFAVIGLIGWWLLLFIIPVILIVALFYNPYSWRRFIYVFSPIALLASLWLFYNFGNKLASYNESYDVITPECINMNKETVYIIPDIYDTKLILVPIDKATNKIKNGYLVKNSTDISCVIERQHIGRVIK